MPVLLDGFVCTAAAAPLARIAAGAGSTTPCSRTSRPRPATGRWPTALGLEPLLDLGMRLGEASGAALAVPLLRAALACHTGMATFAEAGVYGPRPDPRRTCRGVRSADPSAGRHGCSRPAAEPARCVWAYPLVGVVVGGLAGAAFWVGHAAGLPASVAAVWTLAVAVLLTGGLHEDGLADTADGFGGGRTPAAQARDHARQPHRQLRLRWR